MNELLLGVLILLNRESKPITGIRGVPFCNYNLPGMYDKAESMHKTADVDKKERSKNKK